MANRVGIPQAFKEITGKEGPRSLNSYIVKTAKGKKNVMILTTMKPLLGITIADEKKPPALYKLYDFTKGGTNIIDQKMGSYTTKPKCRRWPIVGFLTYLIQLE